MKKTDGQNEENAEVSPQHAKNASVKPIPA